MSNSEKQTQGLGMPWENDYGYAQAVKVGKMVWLAGQLGHDEKGQLAKNMDEQMKLAYQNIAKLLTGFDFTMEDIVEEVLYVTDMQAAFEARKKYGKEVYDDPKKVASTVIVVAGLALPGQLLEIKIVAKK